MYGDNTWFYVTNGVRDEVFLRHCLSTMAASSMSAAGLVRTDLTQLIQDPASGDWYYLSSGPGSR